MAPVPDVVELTRTLVRFDGTTPAGEAACARYVARLAESIGAHVRVLGDPARPSVVARFAGAGLRAPLLVHAHVDVVPVTGQRWTVDPFAAELSGGEVWGRGTVDMKGFLATVLTALSRLADRGTRPSGDVLLAVVPDEESGSAAGAGLLVRDHAELFGGIEHGIGEDGGASLDLGGRVRTHPVVAGEKRACWLRLTFRGTGGHASRVPAGDSPIRALGVLLHALRDGGLPARMTPTVDLMLGQLADVAPPDLAAALARFRKDPDDVSALAPLSERDRRYLVSVTRDTANVTVLHGGTGTNVLPEQVTVDLDARLLDGGASAATFVPLLRAHTGLALDEVEVLSEGERMPPIPLGPLYRTLTDVLRAHDPAGTPVPMTTTAGTDAQLFGLLGIACYGWVPMLPEPGVHHRDLLHAADERIPVRTLRFGEACWTDLLTRTW